MAKVFQFLALLTLFITITTTGVNRDFREASLGLLRSISNQTSESEVYRAEVVKMLSNGLVRETIEFMSNKSLSDILNDLGTTREKLEEIAYYHKFFQEEVNITIQLDWNSERIINELSDYKLTTTLTPVDISSTLATIHATREINSRFNNNIDNDLYVITDINDMRKGIVYNIYPLFKQLYQWKDGEAFNFSYGVIGDDFSLGNESLNRGSSVPVREYFYEYPLDTKPEESDILTRVLNSKTEDIIYDIASTKQSGTEMYYNVAALYNRDENTTTIYTKMFADDEFIEEFKSTSTITTAGLKASDPRDVVKVSAVAMNDIKQEIPLVYVAYLINENNSKYITIKEFSLVNNSGLTLIDKAPLIGDHSSEVVSQGSIIYNKHKGSNIHYSFRNIDVKTIYLVGDYNKSLGVAELAIVVDSDINYIDNSDTLPILRTDRVIYTYEYYPQISEDFYFSYVTQELHPKARIRPRIAFLESMSLNMFIMASFNRETGVVNFHEYIPLIDTQMDSTSITSRMIPGIIDLNFDIRSDEDVNLGMMDIYTIERGDGLKNILFYTEGAYEIDDISIEPGSLSKIQVDEIDSMYNNLLTTSALGNLDASHLILNNENDANHTITEPFAFYIESLNFNKAENLNIREAIFYEGILLSNGDMIIRPYERVTNYRDNIPEDYYLNYR